MENPRYAPRPPTIFAPGEHLHASAWPRRHPSITLFCFRAFTALTTFTCILRACLEDSAEMIKISRAATRSATPQFLINSPPDQERLCPTTCEFAAFRASRPADLSLGHGTPLAQAPPAASCQQKGTVPLHARRIAGCTGSKRAANMEACVRFNQAGTCSRLPVRVTLLSD